MDSISQGPVSNRVSKGMIGLVRGAREVRRLIREASFDSTASEFSIGVSLAEDLGDAGDKSGTGSINFDKLVKLIMNIPVTR